MFKKNKKISVSEEDLFKRLEKLENKMDNLMRYQLDIVKLLQLMTIEKPLINKDNINVKISKN